jgi:hypothetical protein
MPNQQKYATPEELLQYWYELTNQRNHLIIGLTEGNLIFNVFFVYIAIQF